MREDDPGGRLVVEEREAEVAVQQAVHEQAVLRPDRPVQAERTVDGDRPRMGVAAAGDRPRRISRSRKNVTRVMPNTTMTRCSSRRGSQPNRLTHPPPLRPAGGAPAHPAAPPAAASPLTFSAG